MANCKPKKLTNKELIKKLNKYAYTKGLNPKQSEEQIIRKWLLALRF